jgi:protein Mpv17
MWFPLLNRVNFSSKPATAIARASLDQFVAAPLVLGGFFAFAGMLEGKSVDQVKEKVESVSLVWNACLRCAEELMKK